MSNEELYSQDPAVELLDKIGWQEIKDPRENEKEILLENILFNELKRINSYTYKGKRVQFKESDIFNAIRKLKEDLSAGLSVANRKIYDLLTGSRSFKGKDGLSHSFKYIDYDDISNNNFQLIKEFSVKTSTQSNRIKVDIVLFINGIPLVTIECKDPSIEVDQGISQTIRNQGKDYQPDLYKFIQLSIATNKNELKYGTCETPKKFYSVWREENEKWLDFKVNELILDRLATKQDKDLISLLTPHRFFDLFRNFILFDNNTKIIARYQQYFAVHAMLKRIKEENADGTRNGGVIWHTQGSGKSLTMVMLTKALVGPEGIKEGKVVIVTDRVNLDNQITQTFQNTDLKPHAAGSGKDLVRAIEREKDIITTTVHKFEKAYKEGLVEKDKNIFILVDESHRTEHGLLNDYMNAVFPNGCYIGFTGTPLMKKEKNTMRKFGGLIHQYTIKDAVNDKAIVPLIYEGKMVEQSINKDGIDHRIERILKTLNDRQGADLKKKWANYNKMASSNSRLDFIAYDIYEHFVGQFRKNSNDFKAMLATDSKAQAITYLRKFEDINRINETKLKVAVMVSAPDTREGHDTVDAKSNTIVLDHWQRMMKKYDNKDQYETTIKNDFKTGDLDLLIVVDKLLTGFDAPRAVVLYIDKKLKEHNLLQAIARVNRLYTGKDYGFIIDYKGLLEPLNEAMDMYSGAGLEAFDPKDIQGALIDIEKVILDLRNNYSNLKDFFSGINNNKDMEAYEQYLEPKGLRDDFYELLSLFSRDLKTALGSLKILEVLKDDEINKYKDRFAFYQNLRGAVKLRYSDSIDFKEYEDQMKNLLDTYVNATGIMEIVEPANIMNVDAFEKELNSMDSKKAKADMIKTRMAKSIQDIRTSDPARFAKFSELLEEAYRVYKEKRIKEGEQISIDAYLKEMQKIKEDYQRGREVKDYPSELRNNMNAQVVYDLIENFKTEMENEEDIEFNDYAFNVFKKVTAIEIDQIILDKRKPEWHKNEDNINAIEFEIVDRIRDYTNKHDLDISFDNIQKLSNEVVKSARERYRVE